MLQGAGPASRPVTHQDDGASLADITVLGGLHEAKNKTPGSGHFQDFPWDFTRNVNPISPHWASEMEQLVPASDGRGGTGVWGVKESRWVTALALANAVGGSWMIIHTLRQHCLFSNPAQI